MHCLWQQQRGRGEGTSCICIDMSMCISTSGPMLRACCARRERSREAGRRTLWINPTQRQRKLSLSLSRYLPLSVHISIYLSIYLSSLLCLTTPCRPRPLSPSCCSQTNPLLTPTSGGRHQCTIKCGTPGIPEDVGENIAFPYRLDTGHGTVVHT